MVDINTTITSTVEDDLLEDLKILRNEYAKAKEQFIWQQIVKLIKHNSKKFDTLNIEINKDKILIAVITDPHMELYNLCGELDEFCELAVKRNADYILICGDQTNGPSANENHDVHLREFEFTQKRIIDDYPRCGIKTILLGGNHEKDYYQAGFDYLKDVLDYRDDIIFAGFDRSNIFINGFHIQTLHAAKKLLSSIKREKVEKYIQSISELKRPQVILRGHEHYYESFPTNLEDNKFNFMVESTRFIQLPPYIINQHDLEVYWLEIKKVHDFYQLDIYSEKLPSRTIYKPGDILKNNLEKKLTPVTI